jgi:hypothetical protein
LFRWLDAGTPVKRDTATYIYIYIYIDIGVRIALTGYVVTG